MCVSSADLRGRLPRKSDAGDGENFFNSLRRRRGCWFGGRFVGYGGIN